MKVEVSVFQRCLEQRTELVHVFERKIPYIAMYLVLEAGQTIHENNAVKARLIEASRFRPRSSLVVVKLLAQVLAARQILQTLQGHASKALLVAPGLETPMIKRVPIQLNLWSIHVGCAALQRKLEIRNHGFQPGIHIRHFNK